MDEAVVGTNDEITDSLLLNYEKNRDLYADCTARVQDLIRTILASNKIVVHSVASRTKDKTSFTRKVTKSTGKYSEVGEITDFAGIRIITHFHDEVDRVAEIIEKEFSIDEENSVDKRAILKPDSFGYLSLHYVASFSPERTSLTEYARFGGLKFEIQIRSILQHVWAEIEHDLGYKSKVALPDHIKRRFSRLAGLLEVGDSEFAQIRDAINDYKDEVSARIEQTPTTVPLDEVSLEIFVKSEMIQAYDKYIAELFSTVINQESPLSYPLFMLKYIGYENISEIEVDLKKFESKINTYVKVRSRTNSSSTIRRGVSLIYLAYTRVYEDKKEKGLEEMLSAINDSKITFFSPRTASNIIATCKKAFEENERQLKAGGGS